MAASNIVCNNYALIIIVNAYIKLTPIQYLIDFKYVKYCINPSASVGNRHKSLQFVSVPYEAKVTYGRYSQR